jgi:hypothetical protein
MKRLGKAAYLKKLTDKFNFRSVDVGTNLEGSSPPGVFIGRWNYPKVFVGPLLTPQHGDTAVMDTPETWIPEKKNPSDVINYRMNLVRGKSLVGIKDIDNRLVQQMREIALAKNSVESEAIFKKKPQGFMIHEEAQPFGPSAPLQQFSVGNVKWEQKLEKVHHDTDMKAQDAVLEAYKKGVLVSQIQKAFSVGSLGVDDNRKLVPTRWSITAVDDTIGKDIVNDIKHNELIGDYRVYEFKAFKNYFAVLLMPTIWQYEWMEAFIRVMGSEVAIFADHEPNTGKKGYSSVGGCFYSVRLAVAEKLKAERKQAGAIVFREAYPGYVPLGVWLCRELTRNALQTQPLHFENMQSAVQYIGSRLQLPMDSFRKESLLLKQRQATLTRFL